MFIITGANGFLGNNIIRKLNQKDNIEIRGLVLPNDKINSLEGLNCTIFIGDVTRPETLNEIFDVDENDEVYVIHCASIVYIKSEYTPLIHEVNVNGTRNIVAKVLEKNAKLIYISSVHAIPEKPKNEVITEITDFNPDKVEGLYAKTKAEASKYVLEAVNSKGLNACIIHPSGLIGPNDFGSGPLSQLIIDVANGSLSACVKGGYDFADVRDVADGIIQACEKGQKGECYILSNKYIKIKELIDIVRKNMNMKKIKIVLPNWFARLTAPLSELYYKIRKETPLYTKYSLYTLTTNANFSNEKAKNALNYTTRDIKKTITSTIEYFKQQDRIKVKTKKLLLGEK